jgi:hypothetical protein
MAAEESVAKTDPGSTTVSKQLKIARKLKVRIASPTTRAVNVS